MNECISTCSAALVDDGPQSVAHCESQVGTFINSHTERTGDSFEGRQQIYRTRAEAGKHGPNLKDEYRPAL